MRVQSLRPVSPIRTQAVVATALTLLPMLWHWPLLTGLLPDFMDTVTALYPLRMAVARQWAEGHVPLWLPNQAIGYPLAANPQVAAWYPPNWLFYLWPHPITNGTLLIGHVIWGGMGMYRWARVSGARRGPSLFGAVGFEFGSVMVSRMALTPHLVTVAWIPWILWAVERAVMLPGIHWGRAMVVAGFVALQFLAGAPQVSYYTALLLPLWWIGRAWQAGGRAGALRALGQGVVAAVVVVLLCSIQLLPTAELIHQSIRSSLRVDRLQEQGLQGGYVWRALVGGTGVDTEDTDSINAIGAGLLLMVPLALFHRRWRSAVLLALMLGVLFYILALGAMAPVLYGRLPLYESFHAPRRSLMMWSVLGPWIAVAGATCLVDWMRMRGWRRLAPWALVLLLVPSLWMLPRYEREFVSPERFEPDPAMVSAIGQSRFLTVDPTFRYFYDSRRHDYGRSLMPDLASWHNLFDVQVYDPVVLRRMAIFRGAANRNSGEFYPSHGVVFSDPGHPALTSLGLQYLIGRWDLYDPGRIIRGTRMDQQRLKDQLDPVPNSSSPRWPLWRFREERPLAWIPDRVEPAPNLENAASRGAQSVAQRIVFDEDRALPWVRPSQTSGTVRIQRRTPAEFLVDLASDDQGQPRVLCIASAWMPGWQATVLESNGATSAAGTVSKGQRLRPFPINGVILGVEVPPGVTALSLVYAPPSFRTGALLTLLGMIVALALIRLGYRRAE